MLYLLDEQLVVEGVADDGLPVEVIVVGALPELVELVVVIGLGVGVDATHHDVDNLLHLEGLLHGEDGFEHIDGLLLGLHARFGMETVVAVATVGVGVVLAEIFQQVSAAASRTLGIGDHLLDELLGLFLLGDILVGEELVEFLHILFAIEGYALTLATVAAGTTGLLIIALETLGYVVVDDKTHVGLVDTHSEGYGGDDDVDILHEELVLVLGAHLRVEASVVRERLDAVDLQQFGEVFDTLASEAVDDTALAAILTYELYYLLVQLHGLGRLGPHFII